jgi:hypothetical protein
MATENEDKAELFMESFLPLTSTPSLSEDHAEVDELPWEPILEREIYSALVSAKEHSVLGDDGIPCLMWKKIWKDISSIVTNLFEASLRLRYYPKAWRTATIVVLRKSGRPDYTNSSAYRPISLLNTLGKLLEVPIAKIMSYYVKNYNLLSNT